eukprot:TRINITY_DN15259_c0_g1_i1.p1 TRINITY_DN15259_c0_g1~~TRINITY_DN15259_c0_g1_i1.p1  ORF type:complete len:218 (+),score=27.39 TRINITY_DN15259_c0_g1_i1:65-655(+)
MSDTFTFSSSESSIPLGESLTLCANISSLSSPSSNYTLQFVQKTEPFVDPKIEKVLQTVDQTPSSGQVSAKSNSITPSTPGQKVYLGRVTSPVSKDSTPVIVSVLAGSSVTLTPGTRNGEYLTYSVSVANTSGGFSGVPTGSVQFFADSTDAGIVTLVEGAANHTVFVGEVKIVTAKYPGDQNFAASQQTNEPNNA